jgi:DNA-binding MurR/RpiR family transcriptional regulator
VNLADRYLAGETIVSLAADLGVNPSTIHRRLTAEGVKLRGRPDRERVARKLTPKARERITAQHAAGRSVRQITADLGLADVHAIELALGKPAPPAAQRAAKLYDGGLTLDQVAAEIGVSKRTVTRWLDRLGHARRPAGRPAR